MSKHVLEVLDLTKVYGSGETKVTALRNVSMEVERGEFVLVVGSSGSGKSTLLNMMGLLDRPTSGSVVIDGINTASLNDDGVSSFRNKKIGFIFQFANLLPDLSVIENVLLPRQIAAKTDGLYKEAESLLEMVGLGNQMHKRANAISGGQAQRVAIARGLINNPAMVLADEPTGNLDSVTAKTIVNLMKSTAKKIGCTFIIVTHNKEQFGNVDKIFITKDGNLTKDDAPNMQIKVTS